MSKFELNTPVTYDYGSEPATPSDVGIVQTREQAAEAGYEPFDPNGNYTTYVYFPNKDGDDPDRWDAGADDCWRQATPDEVKSAVTTGFERLTENILSLAADLDSAEVAEDDLPYNVAAVALAVDHNRSVRFRYAKGDGSIIESRLLQPDTVTFHPSADEPHYRFVGFDPERNDVRAYRSDRIVGDVSVF
jgi:WYL domain